MSDMLDQIKWRYASPVLSDTVRGLPVTVVHEVRWLIAEVDRLRLRLKHSKEDWGK